MDVQQTVIAIRENTAWLYSPLLDTQFFCLDLWSFAHFWSGIIIFAGFIALNNKKPWMWTAIVLALYEIVEAGIVVSAFRIFQPEKIFDSLNDMIVGMAGALLMFTILKVSKKAKTRYLTALWSPLVLASATISFLWVGSYGYNYNVNSCNFDGINYFTFTCWFLSGIGIIGFYEIIRVLYNKKYFLAQLVTWCVYLPILFSLEFIAYHWVEIHESTPNIKPLIFDIIHGTPILHFFYLTSPLFFIGVYLAVKKLFENAVEKIN